MPDDTQNIPQPNNAGDSEGFLLTEIEERFKGASTFYSKWNVFAKDDYNFALGDQWTEKERSELEQQSRPALTFNRIRSLINLVSGYQRENSARIKVNPEGGEDHIFSQVMDHALKAIDKWGKLGFKLGYQFDDGLYCGIVFCEAII